MKLHHIIIAGAAAITLSSANATTPGEYLDFLYERMPIADSIDHPREFWQENVDLALQARSEMPWGNSVPEREFRHFVLPLRVNNEDLDSARRIFYRELAPRVKGLSMRDAALEVNHWCHEKMNYRPSDGRTSSPLASMRTTWGRCGEESTFGVTAMRAVGIPARQVYTPRWAHTDDNHAWVEVWIDGRWHFLGACEPEPILDLAWFNAPASRGMLMATNAFGKYDGPEQALYSDSCYTRINVTDTYAPLRHASVRVVNPDGSAAADTPVSFRLYNYAELYPLFTTLTDADGRAELLCGHGDLTAWASDGRNFGVVELPADAEGDVTLVLTPDGGLATPLEMTLTPPPAGATLPKPTEAQAAENARRFTYEDSVRNAVMATFFTDASAAAWVKANLPEATDKGRISAQLVGSYGNHRVISEFLKNGGDEAAWFLANLSEKDLRDIPAAALADAFTNRINQGKSPVNPRIANELLTPFCGFFDENVPAELAAEWKAAPSSLLHWVDNNIALEDARNPFHYCISPAGVWQARMADSHSRDIFFVALCRWLDIPARINEVTGTVEWGNPYMAVKSTETTATQKHHLTLTYDGEIPANPAYYIHFTLSRLVDGEPRLLNYPENETLRSISPLELEPGEYILTTGRRMADGSVMSRLEYIDLRSGDATTQLVIPDNPDEISVIGSFNADPLLPVTGRGFFVLAIIAPGHEPSTHLLNELIASRESIERWGKKVVLLFTSEAEMARFDRSKFPGLPSNVVFGVDPDGRYLEEMAEEFRFDEDKSSFPALIIADTFNRVVFHSTGYNVGLGERISSILPRLPE